MERESRTVVNKEASKIARHFLLSRVADANAFAAGTRECTYSSYFALHIDISYCVGLILLDVSLHIREGEVP